MKKYGWKNVRGYAWEQWTLKKLPRTLIKLLEHEEKQLKSKLRKKQNYECFKCENKLYDIDENIPIRKFNKS